MQGDRRLRLVALSKVVALKDAGDGELGAYLQQTGQVHRKDPVTVVHDGGLLGIQDLHSLAHVGLGIGSICSCESCGRVEFLPEGSPISAVPLPMMRVTLWPRSWN